MLRVTSPTTRFTALEFERMSEAGVFGSRRVELINGRIYRMHAQNHPHLWAISKINRVLTKLVPETEWLTVQGTERLDHNTTVDPDFMWLPFKMGTPLDQWTLPILLIEVSDSSYRHDSGKKLRKYAKAGIAEYWIANLPEKRIEVYRAPDGPTRRLSQCRYGSIEHFVAGQAISLQARPEVTIEVDSLLP